MNFGTLVEINEDGLVADAVNLDMVDEPGKNLSLCKGFVFNSKRGKPKDCTVGVLNLIRESFLSPTSPNVHLVVQDYGKGKSHFALAIANYFSKQLASPEVEGILRQVEIATQSESPEPELRDYKQHTVPHLVLRLSGDVGTDLRQMFVRSLRKALEADGLTDTVTRPFCEKPIEYLEHLSPKERRQADQFLASESHTYGQVDVPHIVRLLQAGLYRHVAAVVEISRHLNRGFPIHFEMDLNLEKLLDDVIESLCRGEQRKYQGVLILFDELNAYLQNWVADSHAAGGMALQNLTNACEKHKSRLALVCFTQILPSNTITFLGGLAEKKTYEKLTSRIELSPSTYEPMSSLELVIDALLITKTGEEWTDFYRDWHPTVASDGRESYEYMSKYQGGGWKRDDYHRTLVFGCFPLHPLTAYLLCNLDLTQGRTAIQFIKEDVRAFIAQEPAVRDGLVNYIRAVKLVESFEGNFTRHPAYGDYERATTAVAASASDDDVSTLRALFVYYLAGAKLRKPDNEPHERILSLLSGLSVDRTGECLHRLAEGLGVIHYFPLAKTYRFYSGLGLADLRKAIEAETPPGDDIADGVMGYLESRREAFLTSENVEAGRFVQEKRLWPTDWVFERHVYRAEQALQLLGQESVHTSKRRGVVAYVLPRSVPEARKISLDVAAAFVNSKVKECVVVCLSTKTTEAAGRIYLLLGRLRGKSAAERERYGEAYPQLLRQWEQELDARLRECLDGATIVHPTLSTLDPSRRDDLEEVVSALLDERFRYVAPIDGIDKLRAGHRTGAEIVALLAKQLFVDALSTQSFPNKSYNTVIDGVFVQRWGILKRVGNQYVVRAPLHESISAAWSRIGEACDLGSATVRRIAVRDLWLLLSREPYGHNELTFTALLACWMVFHRAEVKLAMALDQRGPDGKRLIHEESLSRVPLSRQFDGRVKNPKDFVGFLTDGAIVVRRKPVGDVRIPRPVGYDHVGGFLAAIEDALSQQAIDRAKVVELTEKRTELLEGVRRIDAWVALIIQSVRDGIPTKVAGISDIARSIRFDPKEALAFVVPTDEQRELYERATRALTGAVESIFRRYEAVCVAAQDEDTCNRVLLELENDRIACDPATLAPGTEWLSRLEAAAAIGRAKRASLARQRRLATFALGVAQLAGAVNSAWSESNLAETLKRLEALATEYPDCVPSADHDAAREKVSAFLHNLTATVAALEKQVDAVATVPAAERLLHEVDATGARCDTESSKGRVSALREKGRLRLEDLRARDEQAELTERCVVEAEKLATRIVAVRDAPQRARLYSWELAPLKLPEYSDETKAARFRSVKVKACTAVEADVQELCSSRPKHSHECDRMVERCRQVLEALLGCEDLVPSAEALAAHIAVLEADRDELVRQEQDAALLGRLDEAILRSSETVASCDAALESVRRARLELSSPDRYEKALAELEARCQGQRKTLCDQLSNAVREAEGARTMAAFGASEKKYHQLELAFRSSSAEAIYKQAGDALAHTRAELELLERTVAVASSARTMAAVGQARDAIADAWKSLPERCRLALQQMLGIIEERQKSITGSLDVVRERLCSERRLEVLQSVHSELLGQRSVFAGSVLDREYESACGLARQLEDVARLIESARSLESIESCERAERIVEHWLAGTVNPDPESLSRVQEHMCFARGRRSELEQARQSDLGVRLEALRARIDNIRTIGSFAERAAALRVFRDEVEIVTKKCRTVDTEALENLGELDRASVVLVEASTEAQVFMLVEQLPRTRRVAICRELLHRLGLRTAIE